MSTTVAQAIVELEVRDKEALAELAVFERALEGLEKDLRDLKDRKVRVDLDTRDLVAKQKQALRKLKELEQAEKDLSAQKLGANRRAQRQERELLADLDARINKSKDLQRELARQQRYAQEAVDDAKLIQREQKKQYQAERKELNDTRKVHEANQKAEEKAHEQWLKSRVERRRELKRLRDEELRATSEVQASKARAARQAILDEYREGKARHEAHVNYRADAKATEATVRAARDKERLSLSDLTLRYEKLITTLDALAKKRAQLTRGRGERLNAQQILNIDLKVANIDRELDEVRRRFQIAGEKDPVRIAVAPTFSEKFADDLGTRLQQRLEQRGGRGNVGKLAVLFGGGAVGAAVGRDMALGLGRSFRQNLEQGTLVSRIGSSVKNLGEGIALGVVDKFKSLSDMTVRLGPFTASIAKAALALTLLGPTIVAVAGALGALVGVVGSATIGLGALATAFVGGAIPAAIGMATVLKPVVVEFQKAMKASKAYNDAIDKHGKNSDQAKKKLKEFNSVMGHQSKSTREAYLAAGTLSKRWAEITAPARKTAFKVIGDGLNFASKNLKTFGTLTNDTAAQLGAGLRGLFRNLDTGAFAKMFSSFNSAIRPMLGGLTNFINYLARVGASASRYLKPMFDNFRSWTKGLLDTTKDVRSFDGKIDRAVGSLKSLGRFLLATGRLLKTFFGASVDEGVGLLDTMTNAINRWNESLKTGGKESLNNFFKNSVRGAQALYKFLAPLTAMFFKWAIALEPIVSILTQAAAVVGKIGEGVQKATNGFLKLFGVSQEWSSAIGSAVATFGTLYAIKNFSRIAAGIGTITNAIRGQTVVERQLAAARAATNLTAVGPRVGAGPTTSTRPAPPVVVPGMARTGADAAKTATKVTALRGAISALGATVGSGLASAGLTVLAAAAVYGGYKLLSMKNSAEKLRDRIKGLSDITDKAASTARTYGDASARLPAAQRSYARAVGDTGTAKKKLLEIEEKYGRNSTQYANQLATVNAALDARRQREEQVRALTVAKVNAGLKLADMQRKQADTEKLVADAEAARNKKRDAYARFDTDALRRTSDGVRAASELAAAEQTLALARAKRQAGAAAISAAENTIAAATANSKRVLLGMRPLLGQAEQQIGRLAKLRPVLANTIATKYADPNEAGRVAANAQRALASKKVTITTVNKIIADSTSADQAIARLKAASITTKWRVIEEGGKEAIKVAERLNGKKKLSNAEKKIITKGGPEALRWLNAVDRKDVKDKDFEVHARGNPAGEVSAMIAAAQSSIRPITIPVRFAKPLGSTPPSGDAAGAGPGGWKSGGGALNPDERKQDRAYRSALLKGTRQTTGGIYNQPTLLVGEENRSEAVISFNPKYRERNRKYLRQAAYALGVKMPDAAAAGKNAGLPSKIKKLPVPDPYKADAVDVSQAQADRDAWKREYTDRRDALDRINNSIEEKDKKKPKKGGKKNKQGKTPYDTWKTGRDILVDRKKRILYGDSNAKDPMNKVSRATVKARWESTDKQVARLVEANTHVTNLGTRAETMRTRMSNAAGIYNDPRSTPSARNAAKVDYDKALDARRNILRALFEKAKTRRDVAKALLDLSPNSSKLKTFFATAEGTASTSQGEYDAAMRLNPSEELTGPEQTVESYAALKGLGAELTSATLASKEAATTINDSTDDETARQRLFNVFTSLIGSAKAEGMADSNPTLLGSLYDALTGVSTPAGSTAQEDAIKEQAAARENARLRGDLVDSAVLQAFRSSGNNALLQEYFGSPNSTESRSRPATLSEAAAGGRVASTRVRATAAGGTTVNINALTANPKDALQAANTIVGGLGYQGGRAATSTGIGI